MAIKARYANAEMTSVFVVLTKSDTLGNFQGPSEFLITLPSPGNKEHDELEGLVAHGKVKIAQFDPPTIPFSRIITDRQFFAQLALDGVITMDEAEATSNGTMPQILMDALDQIEDEVERFKARMLAKNATSFDRDQPLVAFVASVLQWDADRLDKLWTDASSL